MLTALDALKERAAARPRVALAVAGAFVCAVVLLLVAMFSGGDDVAAVVTPGAAPVPGAATPPATGAPATGTTVAAATPGATPAATGAPAASSGSSGGGGADSAPLIAITAAQEEEKKMNAGLPTGRRTPALGTPVATSNAVADAGKRLEKVADDYRSCIRTAKDYYDCLSVVPKGIKTERIYDSKPYGILVSLKAANGTMVRLSVRGDETCRMFAVGKTCDQWSSAG